MDELAALRLQIEWGADEALLDRPVDRFAPSEAVEAPRPAAAVVVRSVAARPQAMPDAADLPALHAALDVADCPLRATATHTVGPAGVATRLLLIGEAPSADDDRCGQPFSGPLGVTMDRVLGSAGLSREGMMLSFLVPWRPPGGRKPTEGEVAFCLPFMHRLLMLARPPRLVLMSGLALRALTGDDGGIRRARGRWTTVTVPGLDPIPALPMVSPDLWLSSPAARASTWSDVLSLKLSLE